MLFVLVLLEILLSGVVDIWLMHVLILWIVWVVIEEIHRCALLLYKRKKQEVVPSVTCMTSVLVSTVMADAPHNRRL